MFENFFFFLHVGGSATRCAATQASNSPELSVKTLAFASHQIWNEDTVPR